MIALASILVDIIDAVAPAHPALARTVGLAKRFGARVTIVGMLPRVPGGVRLVLIPDLE